MGPVAAPRCVTFEVEMARAFLATLPDERTPWASRLTEWCRERKLSEAQEKAIRITTLRLRVFSTVVRSTRRRRP